MDSGRLSLTTKSQVCAYQLFDQWDRIDVYDPNMTLDGLIQYLDERYGAELSMLSSGVTILFSDFMNKQKMMVWRIKMLIIIMSAFEEIFFTSILF